MPPVTKLEISRTLRGNCALGFWRMVATIALACGYVWLFSQPSAAASTNAADWWSLKPLKRPAVPHLAGGKAQLESSTLPAAEQPLLESANPIDAFVWAKLQEKGLRPSAQADRR